jgi:phage baseplate assembly protein W
MDIAFPYHFDSRGRTALAECDDHVRELIEQLIFTNPGERVNRPEFGSGVLQLVFAPNSPELAATVQFTLQAALQRWLGDVIEVSNLDVTAADSTLRISITYIVHDSGQERSATFTRGL